MLLSVRVKTKEIRSPTPPAADPPIQAEQPPHSPPRDVPAPPAADRSSAGPYAAYPPPTTHPTKAADVRSTPHPAIPTNPHAPARPHTSKHANSPKWQATASPT